MLTPHEKINLIQSLKRAIDEAEKMPTETLCNLCVFYRSGDCSKWKEKIPAEVLGSGCDAWQFDQFSPPF